MNQTMQLGRDILKAHGKGMSLTEGSEWVIELFHMIFEHFQTSASFQSASAWVSICLHKYKSQICLRSLPKPSLAGVILTSPLFASQLQQKKFLCRLQESWGKLTFSANLGTTAVLWHILGQS